MDLKELLRQALEAEERDRKKDREISPEDALEMARVLEQIQRIDLDKVAEEREQAKAPLDRLVEDLKAGRDMKRALVRKTARPKRLHWSQKRNRRRRYERTRYHEVLKPKRKAELAVKLKTSEGWWEVATKSWRRMKVEVLLTREEFEVMAPSWLEKGRVPIFVRYDASKPVSLDNLMVRDNETREVLWDGKEWLLSKLGYCAG